MREIKLNFWGGPDEKGKIVQESMIDVINVLINSKDPKQMPIGLDKFLLFGRLSKAFSKAKETNILILEETDYSFVEKMIKTDVPASWGLNPEILKNIQEFLEVKEK